MTYSLRQLAFWEERPQREAFRTWDSGNVRLTSTFTSLVRVLVLHTVFLLIKMPAT
jgi:hypothetical protein